MSSAAQTQLYCDNFRVEHDLEGCPADIRIYAVSDIIVEFPPVPWSSCQCRSGTENHECYDPGRPVYEDITISAHGKPEQTKAVFEMFDKVAKGSQMRGSISVIIYNRKEGRKDILTITMFDNTLVAYQPLGGMVDVSDPTTLGFNFTIRPERIEFKAG